MALSADSKSTGLLLALLAALVGYIAYSGSLIEMVGIEGMQARSARIAAAQDTVAQLEAATDSAKRELARGTVEDLRRRLDADRSSLALLRRLVPERSEVPNLLDDISTKAKIRGVTLSQVIPQPVTAGPAPFNTDRYTLQVIGRYDQIGTFLADVASLPRIIVPYGVIVEAAHVEAAKALGDTSGALLRANFQIRTYVKSASAEDVGGVVSGT
jgi:type IV pilus assembly protein PilO